MNFALRISIVFFAWGGGGVLGGGGILYPRESESREVVSLDGIWEFRADYNHAGFKKRWFMGPLSQSGHTEMMPVPSSWNDITQSKKLRDHVGWVWYSTTFFVPKRWKDKTRTWLRFGSANRWADVWINGHHLMNHSGGYLPFEGDAGQYLKFGDNNVVVVALNNTLTQATIPQGTLSYPNDTSRYPSGYTVQSYNFDYFNYAGLHRPVLLHTTPKIYLSDLSIITDFDGHEGRVYYTASVSFPTEWENYVNFAEHSQQTNCHVAVLDASGVTVASRHGCSGLLTIPNVKLWWPHLSQPKGEGSGYLYTFQTTILSNTTLEFDVYRLKFGVRTAKVDGSQFLVNGKPFYFRGFGRHEDYSIRGRGVDPVMLVKDHNLLLWTGANSYRTSHYPYAEEILDLTDALGIVIIDESPAIGLTGFGPDLKREHISVMADLVQRDKNRASVLMWSIGNEPKSLETLAPSDVIKSTRAFDPAKRPITIVLSQNFSKGDCPPSMDVVSINRYYGWYGDTGRTEVISLQIPTEVNLWAKTCHNKPVLITEYGAGTVAGVHQSPSFVWTEDFQVDYLRAHFAAFDHLRSSKAQFVGEMIWNFADFATPQETFRPWGCMKGVFTRERQPKAAAHFVRARYWALARQDNLTSSVQLPNDLHCFY
ncbi:Beta-glucuronidase [Folsomia candida]|uniref:Beta-glucuronidase n=1 Tax=Folsomia candida TaxID=158441 RepID=A0A226F5W0_FOLCA|nr:Beta-glucuronidase [Folsomia candida]